MEQEPARSGINAKLVNLAVVLVIISALAFLALWAIPTLSTKANESKAQAAIDKKESAIEDVMNGPDKEWVAQALDTMEARPYLKDAAIQKLEVVTMSSAYKVVSVYYTTPASDGTWTLIIDVFLLNTGELSSKVQNNWPPQE